MKNERLDAALSYARRGWEVFPVPPGTKAGYSIARRGFDNGKPWGKTTDEAEVRAYWRRLPQANVGLAMGIGSGIFDVETDTCEGHANLAKDGAASLAELEAKHGKLPTTLMFVSPSGSLHRLFKHPGGGFHVEHLISKLGIGIDVIGDGFMSVVPPSRKGKGHYEWINVLPVADAPAWLLDMVTKPARAAHERSVWEQFANSTRQADIAEVTLAMAMIPNPDHDWETWNRTAMALFAATGGSEEGFKLFDAWSQRSSKYDAAGVVAKWEALDGCPPREIGAGSLFHWAEEAVPDYLQRCISLDPDVIALIENFRELMGEPE
jgi:Bifunctional DNA primase/polymerase, N-terminal/Primase C terminal 2 (PriCT-2)